MSQVGILMAEKKPPVERFNLKVIIERTVNGTKDPNEPLYERLLATYGSLEVARKFAESVVVTKPSWR